MMFVKIALISGFLFRIQCESGQGEKQDDQNDAELTFVHIVSIDIQTFCCFHPLFVSFVSLKKICRHGERNIEETYPNDPWQSEKYWPGGYGELTNVRYSEFFHWIFEILQLKLDFIETARKAATFRSGWIFASTICKTPWGWFIFDE